VDFSRRARLQELMDEPCSYAELQACLRDLARVNHLTSAYTPTLEWLARCLATSPSRPGPLRIVDVGCGLGDTLREVEQWARRRRLPVELAGIDINPHATRAAETEARAGESICWIAGDAYSYRPTAGIDIVISSLFTHHLADHEIIRFLAWMENTARAGWFISDLHRHPVPYHLFKLWSRLAGWHPFVQHDGPVSILRGFTSRDWKDLCRSAGLPREAVRIEWHMPFRVCVGRVKPYAP
jgi:SAM-dependent methyltransferase